MKSVSLVLFVTLVISSVLANVIQPNVGFPVGPVVGGQNAVPHSAPWIVSLQRNRNHHCGGSIISPDWILTAAHCIVNTPPTIVFEAVAGKHDIGLTEVTEERRVIDRLIPHQNYPGGVAPFDIGLAHLQVPFALTSSIRIIPLPPRDVVHSGQATLFGWGSTSTGFFPSYPRILQTVNKPIVDYATCEQIFGSRLHPTNICTGPLTGGISACSGDSGGPLDQNGVIVGIVSWGGIPCGRPNSPSVFVRVSAFIDWIDQNRV